MRILLHDKLKAWHEVLKLGEKPIELLNSRASRRDLPFPSAPQPKLVKTCRKERQAPIHSLVRAEPTIDTDWYLRACPLLLPARATFVCVPAAR